VFADALGTAINPTQAYRSLAKVLHPDKGGNAAAFAALQAAFETLSDPQARAAYDSLAADLRFRPGAAAPYSNTQQVGIPTLRWMLAQDTTVWQPHQWPTTQPALKTHPQFSRAYCCHLFSAWVAV